MIAAISSPRDAVGVCILGDKVFAVGGYDGQQYLQDVECYDPVNNEWAKVMVLKSKCSIILFHFFSSEI